jgi:tRNA(Met) C34 N-acetyltransferase TmcA
VVEGGGIIIMQAPPWDEWDNKLTLFKQSLLVPGFEEPRHIFISWFKRKLLEHKTNIFIYDADADKLISGEPLKTVPSKKERKVVIPARKLFPTEIYRLALTNDQVKVISNMEWFYDKPPKGKRKVLVVTADRGRGKSCAVGIGLIGLAKTLGKIKHRVRILVTAPSLSNVQSLMELAFKAAEVAGHAALFEADGLAALRAGLAQQAVGLPVAPPMPVSGKIAFLQHPGDGAQPRSAHADQVHVEGGVRARKPGLPCLRLAGCLRLQGHERFAICWVNPK